MAGHESGVGAAGPPGADDLARLGTSPGLCATCRHAAVLASKSSAYLRCGRSAVDPSFPRYPRLPVLACRGHEPLPGGTAIS